MKIEVEKKKTTEDLKTHEHFWNAREILATPDYDATAFLLRNLLPSPGIQEKEARIDAMKLYNYCAENFRNCLTVKLVGVYASERRDKEGIREIAIRRLNILLSKRIKRGEASLAYAVIEQISPILIACLYDEESEDTFKILVEVVAHVAYEIFICHDEAWAELCDCIYYVGRSDFRKASYIFQNLPLPLDQDEFLMPLMETLFLTIVFWLDPSQSQSQLENNWYMAFAAAFCLAIHLMEAERVDLAENLAYYMLKSVTELVKNKRELGFVRRALRDLEKLVRKQSLMYCQAEYRFVLGLIRRINGIKGLKKESKIVIWRIRLTLQVKTAKSVRENGKVGDWLNQNLCMR